MCTPVTLDLIGYRDEVKTKAESLPRDNLGNESQ